MSAEVIRGIQPGEISHALSGKVLKRVRRKGKYLWLELDSKPAILVHLGMTGSLVFKGVKPSSYKSFSVDETSWPPRFWKVLVRFETGAEMAFVDSRRFGRFELVDDPAREEPVRSLGDDAYLELGTVEGLHEKLSKRKQAIKAVLLDQKLLCGIGNWVADEVLYHSRIHPEVSSSSLTLKQTKSLHASITTVLKTAVEAEADASKFPRSWLFHYRWTGKKPSKIASGDQVKFITVGSRTTAYVPSIQKKGTKRVKGDHQECAKTGTTKRRKAT